MSKQHIYLPAQFSLESKVLGSPVQQLLRPEICEEVEVSPYAKRGTPAWLLRRQDGDSIFVARRSVTPPEDAKEVLLISSNALPANVEELRNHSGRARWLKPQPLRVVGNDVDDYECFAKAARASWREQFFFREELRTTETVIEEGLRSPQMAALHEALGHWQVTNDPATIVLPTGTGKTETMLALLTCKRLERLLVVVPWSLLREQITAKFVTLGLLKQIGVIGPSALYPVVGTLKHYLHTKDDVEAYFRLCNVIVTTMSVVSGCSEEAQRKMSEMCSHLFIDEAHHISAPTWDQFRRRFLEKPILQFTATPYRSDGKHVDGKIICNYPLRKAQEEGYFKLINFLPIRSYYTQTADREISQAAVKQLEIDLSKNLNHIVMARAKTIDRAEEIYQIYKNFAAAHNPLLIHSDHSDTEKREAIRLLREGKSRIIVCVNMLGEGFDLPELKIAALHDRHKSLAITLQFMGRFTRTMSNIGEATVITNIGLSDMDDALQDLYAEDADWNFLLRRLSEGATGRQLRRSEFIEGFSDAPDELPLQNILPKMSAVSYRTRCRNWRPKGVLEAVEDSQLHTKPAVNHKHKVLLFVTREKTPITWGSIKEIHNTTWNLYLMHWDAKQGLLFINSSNNDSAHEELAKAVVGDDAELIRGEQVFRSLNGIKRPILMNLGLKHSLSRAVRFTMYVGSDIHEGLTDSQRQNKIKSNTFARGYESGEKATVGCSVKGRIWSYLIAYDLSEWVEWCQKTGAKLLDDSISVEEIFKNILVPKQLQERPALVPLTIEWSEDFLLRSEDSIRLDVAGEVVSFFDAGMELVEHKNSGPLRFRIFTENNSVEYEVKFRGNTVEYVPTGTEAVEMIVSRRHKTLSEWFQEEPPIIRFEDSSFLIYNEFIMVRHDERAPFDKERIVAWDWIGAGVNIKKESQATKKNPTLKRADSIQGHLIQRLISPDYDPHYDIVFDDDDTNEAADVVAIKVAGDRLMIHFYHCKYTKEERVGARVDDLYVVCGQAQRSAHWKFDVKGLIAHLRSRDASRMLKYNVSRFEQGDLSRLDEIARQVSYLAPEFKIFVVQPAYSKSKAETSHLDLFATTELYLQETAAAQFGVIVSP